MERAIECRPRIGAWQTSAVEVGLDYAYVWTNAPPAACGCFSMNGGGGNLVINMRHGVSLVAHL